VGEIFKNQILHRELLYMMYSIYFCAYLVPCFPGVTSGDAGLLPDAMSDDGVIALKLKLYLNLED
jgi:hypothetical protein